MGHHDRWLAAAGVRGMRALVAGVMVSTVVLVPDSPATAASTATIGAVTTGTRPGSEVGRTNPSLPTLQYCVTYDTTDQARDYGYEILDAAGVRPPFGSAFTRQFEFVPAADWAAGSRLSPKTLCNSVTLEPGRTYTLRAWVTSGSFDTRGSWALTPASAPTAASYTHVTADNNTTTTTTPPSRETPTPGAGGGSPVRCPPSAPVRTEVNGSATCVALDIYCRSNPGWVDASLGLACPRVPGSSGQGSPAGGIGGAIACNASASPQRAGRSVLRVSTTNSLARQVVQLEVLSAKKWYVLGSARITKKGLAVISTNARVINAKKSYRIRATQGSRVLCAGSLTVPVRMNLRGTARLA